MHSAPWTNRERGLRLRTRGNVDKLQAGLQVMLVGLLEAQEATPEKRPCEPRRHCCCL